MVIFLQILSSLQPVLLRHRAARRGANAGPIREMLSYKRCRDQAA
jgi:hypothetical protein